MIERLRRLQIGQYIREEGPQAHKAKAGTPTMGGVLILAGILVPTLLWGDLTNRNIWILDALDPGLRRHRLRRRLPEGGEEAEPRPHRAAASSAARSSWGSSSGTALYSLSRRRSPRQYSTRVRSRSSRRFVPDLGLLYIVFAVLLLVVSPATP